MRIGIDCRVLTKSNYTGVEVYTWNLVKNLIKEDISNTYTLYFDTKPTSKIISELGLLGTKVELKVIKNFLSWTQLKLPVELFFKPVDVFFSPIHTLPFLSCIWTKTLVMIHGLEYEKLKGNPLFNLLKGYHERVSALIATHIVVPSAHTRNSLVSKFNIKSSKISVVNEGVDINPIVSGIANSAEIQKKYRIESDYLIFVSTVEPRKNIPFLVEVFSKYLSENPESNLILLICGKMGWDYANSINSPKKFGIDSRVKFLGYIPDEDLPGLVAGSKAFVSASTDEGFGLHLLEAMASGTKILVSDIPAYREIGSDYLKYFSLNNKLDFPAKLTQLLSENTTLDRNRQYSKILTRYSWSQTARDTLVILNSVANSSFK